MNIYFKSLLGHSSQFPLLSAPKNNLLKDRLGVLVAKGAAVGSSHVLVVLHPKVEVDEMHFVFK